MLLLPNCTSEKSAKKLNIEGPKRYVNLVNEKTPISTVYMPLSMSVKEIEKRVNNEFKNGHILYKDDDLKKEKKGFGLHTQFEIKKVGDLSLEAKNDYVYADMTLSIKARLKHALHRSGLKYRDAVATQAKLKVRARTKVYVNSNWQPIIKTEIEDFTWINVPKVDMWGLGVDVADFAEKRIEKMLPNLLPKIDAKVKSKVDIRTPIRGVWMALQYPIQVKQAPPTEVWLKMNPVSVSASPLRTFNDTASILVGMGVYSESVIGSEPPFRLNTKLPNTSLIDDTLANFKINLSAAIKYEDVNELLNNYLVGQQQRFFNQKHSIEIADVEVYPSGDKLAVQLDLKGYFNGKVYLTGTPKWDNEQQLVYVDDFDYDVNTANVIVNILDKLQHRSFVKTVQSYLTFPLGVQVEEAQCQLNDLLANAFLGKKKNVRLTGEVRQLQPLKVQLNDTAIAVIIAANGSANMHITLNNKPTRGRQAH